MKPRSTAVFALGMLLCLLASASAKTQYADVEQAVVNFSTLQPGQQAVAAVVVNVKNGFHVQSHTPTSSNYIKFVAAVDENPALSIYEPVYPLGKLEKYKAIGDDPLSVYSGKITVYIPFQVKADAKPGELKIGGKISYQACDDQQCYFPTSTPFTIETKVVGANQSVEPQNGDLFKGLDPTIFTRVGSNNAAAPVVSAPVEGFKLFGKYELKQNSYALAFIAAFIAGIIFNAVPCVLPVLPLKAIGFYEVSRHNRAKCLAFGAVFSLGLIASFAALALVIVVYKKVGWGEIYSNLYFNIAIVVVLVAMAIGTFGAFSVNLPTAIYNVTPRHDTYFGNFLFGILTAILSTPCTFGLFLGLLVWAASQPALIGVSLVMTVGGGMAFPYFLLSAFPELARKFPRTGPWSELVKQSMSFLLLGSAVFFARRFIQPYTGADGYWWTLFAVAAAAGLFLVVRTMQISSKLMPRLVTFAIAIVFVGGTFITVREVMKQPFTWTPYSSTAMDSSLKAGRIVVIDFTATWCSNCQVVETHTLHDKSVVDLVKAKNVDMIKADLTLESAEGWALLKKESDVAAIPLTLVYSPGNPKPQKLAGIYSPEQLTAAIDRALHPGS